MSTVSTPRYPADQPNDTLPTIAAPDMTYTPQRYAALRATGQNLIVATFGDVLQRADGLDLDQEVFAALAALHTAGYLRPQPSTPLTTAPSPTTPPTPRQATARVRRPSDGTCVPVRLTLRGWGLLDRFRLEHGRRAATSATAVMNPAYAGPDVRTANPPPGEQQPRDHVRQPHVAEQRGVDQP